MLTLPGSGLACFDAHRDNPLDPDNPDRAAAEQSSQDNRQQETDRTGQAGMAGELRGTLYAVLNDLPGHARPFRYLSIARGYPQYNAGTLFYRVVAIDTTALVREFSLWFQQQPSVPESLSVQVIPFMYSESSQVAGLGYRESYTDPTGQVTILSAKQARGMVILYENTPAFVFGRFEMELLLSDESQRTIGHGSLSLYPYISSGRTALRWSTQTRRKGSSEL